MAGPHERRLAAQHPGGDRDRDLRGGGARRALDAPRARQLVNELAHRGRRAGGRRGGGRDALRSDPVEALRNSNESLALHDDSVPALYVKGAAYARLGRYRAARSVLEEAIEREPNDHLTWALLGDLEARRGKFRAARRNYRRSLKLNPRNPFVRDLVRDPRSAVRDTR